MSVKKVLIAAFVQITKNEHFQKSVTELIFDGKNMNRMEIQKHSKMHRKK